MLVPAFIVAEATLSYVGLGFPDTSASWGTMLQDASTIGAFADFPWLLSPAAAMFLVVLGVNLALQGRGGRGVDVAVRRTIEPWMNLAGVFAPVPTPIRR